MDTWNAPTFLLGMATSWGLIVAIGAQNAFVLRQGLRREWVGSVVLVCALTDIVLIALGVAGLSWVSGGLPWLVPALTAVGVVFLASHGIAAARRAWRPVDATAIDASTGSAIPVSRRRIVLQAAAFSWLNPHAWLDTTVLIGSLAHAQLQAQGPGANWVFAGGAMSASALWFTTLAWAAGKLAPWFQRPQAWRALDAGIALMLLGLAAGLAHMAWQGWQAIPA
ncbi:LysE/ArgO family amino acid transporter [Sphaerotilus mobilis]|uniref:L-lysine exporter family protein LysE/ArgO n=1 Tax=Sphaerotilus mobilis TaxID=47994 RepID=A0A4Q7LBL8_9BURK|nr:LysE family transporter [Sphaerotilus mobilis]RZS47557.1 L-lysine exporter family protein LysE/ArgO [Sphaerotilus mobilis]